MIIEYHRPKTLADALVLLNREEPRTIPLAGGSKVNQPNKDSYAVVDLQALGLGTFEKAGNFLEMGAMLRLQEVLNQADLIPEALLKSIKHEATYNLRQVASVAGTMVASDGCSPFTTAMLALDATLTFQPGDEMVSLGEVLPFRNEWLKGRLITKVIIPSNVQLCYEYVARTPADRPIVCTALAIWPSGRTRLALGGYNEAPLTAFDGPNAQGLEVAARSAYSQAEDDWASAEYRQHIAGVLASRCLNYSN